MVSMWFGIVGIVLGTGGITFACWQWVDRKHVKFELAEALKDIKRKDKQIKELDELLWDKSPACHATVHTDWESVRQGIQEVIAGRFGKENVQVIEDPPEPGA